MPRALLKRHCAFYVNREKEDTEVALLAGDLTGGSCSWLPPWGRKLEVNLRTRNDLLEWGKFGCSSVS